MAHELKNPLAPVSAALSILEKQDHGKNTVFLSQSGWGSKEHFAKSQAAGFKEHFVKPADHDKLEEKLLRYL